MDRIHSKKHIIFIFLILFSCFGLNAQMRKTIPFHGRRLSSNVSEFYVTKVSANQIDDDTFIINVSFNSIINPQSVQLSNIMINSVQLPTKTKIVYNRSGNLLRLVIPLKLKKNEKIDLDVQKISSFNGIQMSDLLIEGIIDDFEIVFSESSDD